MGEQLEHGFISTSKMWNKKITTKQTKVKFTRFTDCDICDTFNSLFGGVDAWFGGPVGAMPLNAGPWLPVWFGGGATYGCCGCDTWNAASAPRKVQNKIYSVEMRFRLWWSKWNVWLFNYVWSAQMGIF